ncbi:hypothetical protein [Bosea sp. 124]|uniref:hypothetical protein n=1 Tax=Bosea sp. 124 TaxID=2135642 RepID=UPI000D3A23A2|nr:hypothetical protein [Bosea sp. 124]PTM40829.1 hypothetical protein C8D03_2360 [Bosea sp. 124]
MAALAYRHQDHRSASRQSDLFTETRFGEDEPVQAARELPMRSTAGLGERRFTAWRGRSGRRYVASIFAIGDGHALGFTDAILLAVSGERRILAARDSGPLGIEAALTRWQQAVTQAGASEIHVHLLAEDGISRRAALLDLMPEV